MTQSPHIAIANGDGIGAEVMFAALSIMREVGVVTEMTMVEIGRRAFAYGFEQGIPPSCLQTILCSSFLLKAPTLTLNDTLHAMPLVEEAAVTDIRFDLSPLGLAKPLTCRVTDNQQFKICEPIYPLTAVLNETEIVDPAPMMLATALLLEAIDEDEAANLMANAVLSAYETARPESCEDFVESVVERIGNMPNILLPFNHYQSSALEIVASTH